MSTTIPIARGQPPAAQSAAVAVVLLLTGMLLAVQLRTERTIQRTLGVPSPRLQELAFRLRRAEVQRQNLERDVASLRDRIAVIGSAAAEREDGLRALAGDVDRLRVMGGFTAVEGPGIVVELRDSSRRLRSGEDPNDVLLHYTDLQAVVNELWVAGAEAVAINGERFTTVSAIQCVGTTVLVNRRRLSPPFRIDAVGEPAALRASLTRPSGAVAYLRAFGFPASVTRAGRLRLPPYRGPLSGASSQPH